MASRIKVPRPVPSVFDPPEPLQLVSPAAGTAKKSLCSNGIGIKAKAKINAALKILEQEPIKFWHKTKLAEKLKGQKDLWAVTVLYMRVQYRPIGIVGPGENTFTLLAGAIEKENKYIPATVFEVAQGSKAIVQAGPAKYRRPHDYSEAT